MMTAKLFENGRSSECDSKLEDVGSFFCNHGK